MLGALAQLGERLICIQEVSGSIPLGSTKILIADQDRRHGNELRAAQIMRVPSRSSNDTIIAMCFSAFASPVIAFGNVGGRTQLPASTTSILLRRINWVGSSVG